jgi:hypothetical protein
LFDDENSQTVFKRNPGRWRIAPHIRNFPDNKPITSFFDSESACSSGLKLIKLLQTATLSYGSTWLLRVTLAVTDIGGNIQNSGKTLGKQQDLYVCTIVEKQVPKTTTVAVLRLNTAIQ